MAYIDDTDHLVLLNLVPPTTCTVEINNGFQTINPVDAGIANFYHDFGEFITVSHLQIYCDGMSVSRPSAYSTDIPNAFPARMIFTFRDNPGTNHLHVSTAAVTIMDEPALHHQYHWAHPGSSEIAVTFTFYRPAWCVDTEFTFEDPHLQVVSLRSLALPDDNNRLEDLPKPFHLLSVSSITCLSAISEGYMDAARAELEKSELFISSAPPLEKPFICTFQLLYPPDAIAAIHHQPYAPKWSIRYASGTNNPVEGEIPLPYAIPDQYRESFLPSYYGIHIWRSSYHFFSTQHLTFEFGIATSHQFIDLDSPHKMVKGHDTPQQMAFQIYTDGIVFSLSEWQPSMLCGDHTGIQSFPISINGNEIDINSNTFGRFGKKCTVTLAAIPTVLSDRILGPIHVQFKPSLSADMRPLQYYFTLFNAFHRAVPSPTQHAALPLYDPTHVDIASLPPIQRFQFPSTLTHDATTGNTIYHLQMNVQYLSPRAYIDSEDARMVLLCVFPQLRAITDLNISIAPIVTLKITSGGYPIFFQENVQLSVSQAIIPATIDVPDDSNEMDIFQHDRPIRAPYLAIPLSVGFDATRPLSITLSIPAESASLIITSVSSILLPQQYADALVYSRQYAIITPIRSTPLTGYSYRCVNWDQMAASYVYAGDAEQLTDINSNVCPPFPQDGEVIDPAVWRRTRHTLPSGETRCAYELAAVCVAPSTIVEGAYDIHPLADCPSFLGSIHSVSCNDSASNDEREWNSNNEGFEAQLSTPELDENGVHKKRFIRLQWLYMGDPRRTLTASIKPLLEGRDNDGEDEPHGWITLARDIPAYLPLPLEQQLATPQWQGITIGFPILSPMVEAVTIRLTLNGAIGAGQSTQIPHTVKMDQWGYYRTDCEFNLNKLFDDVTHLCRCADGTTASGPTSVENPLVHPLEFDCILSPRCESPDFEWDATTGRCVDDEGNVECDNHGVWSPSFQRCVCMTGYYGQYCQYDDTTDPTLVCEELQCVADHTMRGGMSGEGVISRGECTFSNERNDSGSSSVICNCADGFTGDQCQHQAVCGVQQCMNGRLISPTGKPEECKCECNNDYITGTTCNQCSLACRNGGVANTRCTACQCPAGYIGTTCTIPVWYHTFTLRNLPQHIVELILGTTASDKEQMAILQQTMVKYLLEDYSRVLSETFIVVDGNNNGGDNPDGDDTRIRVRVELSQFQTVIPPANPNAPYVHIQLMLYPADMTEEMLAYALQHGLMFDWSRVTGNLDFFKQFLREQGIIDDNDDGNDGNSALLPEITDPSCTTRECRDESNHAPIAFVPVMILFTSLVAMISLSYA